MIAEGFLQDCARAFGAAFALSILVMAGCAAPDVRPCPHPGLVSEWKPLAHKLQFPDLTNEPR